MSHFRIAVITDPFKDPAEETEKALAPFSEELTVPKYIVGDIPKFQLDAFREYYLRKFNVLGSVPMGDLYHRFGKDWNGGVWEFHQGRGWVETSTKNPNTKWNWWMVGGRWTGSLRLKPGKTGFTGKPGLQTKPNTDPMRCDRARIGDIDWPAMMLDGYRQAEKSMEAIGPEIDWLLENNASFDRIIQWLDLTFRWDPKDSSKTYCQRCANEAISFFAVVDAEGRWCARGEMGWFGIVRDDQDFWDGGKKALSAASPEHWITVVDCHI